MPRKPTFEESIDVIDNEIQKRKPKWTLTAINWMDFEDVSQIIRIHIHKKWHMYDENQPLKQWVNKIITNQISNILRNNYGNYKRPCLDCPLAEGLDLCRLYEVQCSACPLYAKWEKKKKHAYNIKLPVPIEYYTQELHSMESNYFDMERGAANLHKKLKEKLKPNEWKVYQLLYIEHKTDEEIAKLMHYKTSEKGRSPGYKMIKNFKKKFLELSREMLDKGEVEF